ncbi:MAG TPA: hypothetical protein VNO43_08030 [Candidatus Eisenbacteria bacterium]|nr:hypothetical protein [Candidatus Eisenbacteria bacterium]
MKHLVLAVTLLVSLPFASPDAIAHDPSYQEPYWGSVPYQDYVPYPYDPYYELHLIHYQLYRPSHAYPMYRACCATIGVPILITPVLPPPPVISSRPRSVVGPTPRAVGPLPGAVPGAGRR